MLTSTSAGVKTLTFSYPGDANFNASPNNTAGHLVNQASTTTAVISSSNPVGTGIPVTFTATVSPVAPGAGIRTGTVTFSRGGTPICSNVAINVSGQATCNMTFTIAGNYNITVQYSGDSNFTASVSPTLVQMVSGPTAASVSITGRVQTQFGRGIGKARIILTDQNGEVVTAISNSFGYYRLEGVRVGETYFLIVRHKEYQFAPRSVTVNDDIHELNFIALE
jgi:hypothetical protein